MRDKWFQTKNTTEKGTVDNYFSDKNIFLLFKHILAPLVR